jgi:hypothetical protein
MAKNQLPSTFKENEDFGAASNKPRAQEWIVEVVSSAPVLSSDLWFKGKFTGKKLIFNGKKTQILMGKNIFNGKSYLQENLWGKNSYFMRK